MKLNFFKSAYVVIVTTMTLILIHYAGQVYRGGHGWKTGDWLINYSDGLIRRGFIGEFSMQLGSYSGIGVKWTVFAIQAVAFVCFVYFVLNEFLKHKETRNSALLLLSPAFAFMFWVNSNASVFRKELLVYLVLILLLKAFLQSRVNYFLYWLGVVLFLVTGLSHEIAIFVLPFLFFCIWDWATRNKQPYRRIAWLAAPLGFASVFILYVALLHKGSITSMQVVCDSLNGQGFRNDICGGAIEWLQYDANFGFQEVLKLGAAFWLNYAFLALITFAPLLILRIDRTIWLLIAASIVWMMPLFIVAVDYGRFISVLFTCTILILIWNRPGAIKNAQRLSVFAGCLYCFTWTLPNCCSTAPELGFFVRLAALPFGLND